MIFNFDFLKMEIKGGMCNINRKNANKIAEMAIVLQCFTMFFFLILNVVSNNKI